MGFGKQSLPLPEEPHSTELATVPAERIERKIYLIRGHKVMLDRHLAEIYGVQTFRLNEAVKRNIARFRLISCFN